MNDFFEMHLFFFVTTIVVVLIGIFIVLILFKLWQILGHVEKISREVSEESVLLRQDIHEARLSIQAEGFKLKHIISFFRGSLRYFMGKDTKKEGKKTRSKVV